MTYRETLDYLYSSLPAYQRIGKAAYKADLETTHALDKYFGHPHLSYKTVHVAGTNGKGSVSHLLASVLAEAGYKVGLYTSPHLLDFRERIRVNGTMIGQDYVVDFVDQHAEFFGNLKPSFFEMTVAMAFLYFKDMEVDIAVIETGLGGRLDSTNIIDPLVSVITNISLDHTQFLGSTKKAIAGEKAGIIKKDVPVVVGRSDPETSHVFIAKAKELKSKLVFADRTYRVEQVVHAGTSDMLVRVEKAGEEIFAELRSGLAGLCQEENIVTALAALDQLGKDQVISATHILDGFKKVVSNTGIMGRWQLIRKNPLVICDTAHNSDGLKGVISQLSGLEAGTYRFIIGFVNDKKIDDLIRLFPKKGKYYLTRASIPRALETDKLLAIAGSAGLDCDSFPNVRDAYETALNDSSADDLIFVGGSSFIVADFLGFQK